MEQSSPFVMHARTITSTGGGPDKTILNSPRFLKNHGFRSACMFFHPPGDTGFQVQRDRAEQVGARLIEIEDKSRIDLKAIRSAIRHCRSNAVDIWHAHDYKTNLVGLVARKFHPMKLITTVHGWVNFDGQTPRYYELDKKWFLPRYDQVICVSDTVLEQCLDAGLKKSRCLLIENAIDTEQFHPSHPIRDGRIAKHESSNDQLVIGSIGRLATEKGFDLLIAAFLRVLEDGINARLVIAGEGPDQTALEDQIKNSGMADRIQLLGFQCDTAAFYEKLDIFVLSSHREGLPNVLLEAMAMGTPVIATRVGGVERVVQDESNGLLIPSGSVEAIHSAIKRLTCKRARSQLACEAVMSIDRQWSFTKRMELIANLYQDALAD